MLINRFVVGVGLISLTAIGTLGCEQTIDNQKVIRTDDAEVSNPLPSQRDYALINSKHKILVGVIDSGIDYNQPYLLKNIHFKLDEKNQPIGFGRDFVADDSWAAPFITRTAFYNPKMKKETQEKALQASQLFLNILEKAPFLEKALNPKRNVEQEIGQGVDHGTHVAGLASYDREDLGLIAYRILPQNKYFDDNEEEAAFDSMNEFIDMLTNAIDLAAADGVRVVNMSIGAEFSKALADFDDAGQLVAYQKLLIQMERIQKTMEKYPHILFVAAAGNSAAWTDQNVRNSMPCGIKTKNLLCVGALRENGELAHFSNVLLNGADIVFALGHPVLSTVPGQICSDEQIPLMASLASQLKPGDALFNKFIESISENCKKIPLIAPKSGTSMASPLVARQAAEILVDHPEFNAQQVIQAIYKKSLIGFAGTLPVYKLRIKKPSWYVQKGPIAVSASKNRPDISTDDQYWDAYSARGAK